ncbi:hypothetical protein MKEN_00246200 [Mycena kentingensis (nom. inval.)]|nr:hypothetical protein MKEN_00246200 [Mycena kentingensis (nom. inval.)]
MYYTPQHRRTASATPRSVRRTNWATYPFVPPVRAPLLPTAPSPFLSSMPPRSQAGPAINLSAPSALGWAQHVLGHHHELPTPANTLAWPATPLPSFDTGIVTLPIDSPAWVPGSFPPAPFGTPVPMHIHPTLIPNPLNPTLPTLQWDILHAPEQARLLTGREIFKRPGKIMGEAVVFPDASTIWICADPASSAGSAAVLGYWMSQWGPIVVESGAAGKPVKILALLDAIRAYFQTPLTDADLDKIRASKSQVNPFPLAALKDSAFRRADDAYELPGISKKEFKRVDVLGAYRQWGGVRPVVFQDGTWRLWLTLLPYAVPRR